MHRVSLCHQRVSKKHEEMFPPIESNEFVDDDNNKFQDSAKESEEIFIHPKNHQFISPRQIPFDSSLF